jgi:hypothetical protein
MLIPVISQYVTAPLHIHAMDIYARPVATAAERVRKVVEEYKDLARALRILPAFGIDRTQQVERRSFDSPAFPVTGPGLLQDSSARRTERPP